MRLEGKVALITGGARIGAVVAEELAKKGCHVAMTYRSSKRQAINTAKNVERAGVRSLVVRADVSREADVRKLVAAVKKEFRRLDIVINMASVYEKTLFEGVTEKQWESIVSSNLKSAYFTVKHAAPLLRVNGGRVVNFSDWVAASGRPRYKEFLPYYAAKAGVIGLTEAMALELAPKVLVNAVAPGPILPPVKISNEEVRDVKRVTPLGKWGGPLEIAKAVSFLCKTDFVTGECIRVDGGRHLY